MTYVLITWEVGDKTCWDYNVQGTHLGLVVDKVGQPGGEGGEVLAPPLHLPLHTQPEL